MLTVLLVLLAACANTDEVASSRPEEPVKSVENDSVSEKIDSNDAVDVSKENNEENATDENVDAEAPDTGLEATDENSELKNLYLTELTAIESVIESMPEGETEIEMEEIAADTYKIWDDELNKVWKELEKQLPVKKMDKLREEQRRWIKLKYETASKEAEQYKGGTMESLVKISTLAKVTKERCYELVEAYM